MKIFSQKRYMKISAEIKFTILTQKKYTNISGLINYTILINKKVHGNFNSFRTMRKIAINYSLVFSNMCKAVTHLQRQLKHSHIIHAFNKCGKWEVASWLSICSWCDGRWIDPSWWTDWAIFFYSVQCSTTDIMKAWYVLSYGTRKEGRKCFI